MAEHVKQRLVDIVQKKSSEILASFLRTKGLLLRDDGDDGDDGGDSGDSAAGSGGDGATTLATKAPEVRIEPEIRETGVAWGLDLLDGANLSWGDFYPAWSSVP
jgi:hypothetical protein